MKRTKKQLFYLLFIITLLFILYLIPKAKEKILSKNQKLFPFKKEQIKEIIFQFSKDNSQSIKKTPQGWVISDNQTFPADKNRIENLLDFLTSLEKKEIVSKNKSKHKNFGITDKKIVIINKNGKDFTLYIGKPAGLQKYYVRIDNENEIFTAEGLDLYPEDFRDLSLHFITSTEKIKTIEIINFKTGEKILIKKTKISWKVNTKKADKTKIDFFLSDLFALKGKNISQKKKTGKLELIIKVREDNKEKELYIYKIDQEYWANIKNRKYFYKLSSTSLKTLQKTEKDFLP